MKHLLDVNVLLAAIHQGHSRHSEAFSWLKGRQIVLCPLSELGFLRISTNRRAIAIPMREARKALQTFSKEHKAEWIADDLPALDSKPEKSEQVADSYLADLAAKHGHRLATLDQGIKHPAADLIS